MVAQTQPDLEVIPSGGFLRRDRVVPALLALLAILLAALIVRDAFFPPEPAAAAANTTTVRVGNVQAAVSGTGSVAPVQQQNVNFKVSGALTELDVKIGDPVAAGQTLAKIDPATYQTALSQAQATLNADQQALNATNAASSVVAAQNKLAQDQAAYNLQKGADQATLSADQSQYNTLGCVGNPNGPGCQAQQARIDQDQIKLLSDQNTLTNDQSSLNSAQLSQQSSLASQQAKVSQDQTNVQTAQQNLNDTTLTAPIAGTVLTLNGQIGDTLASGGGSASASSSGNGSSSGSGGSGGTSSGSGSSSSSSSSGSGSSSAFLGLGNLSAMQVVAPFAEADAAKVKVSQAATFTFDAISNLTLTGHVIQVAGSATTVSNVTNYNVTLALDNLDSRLKSGMTANATVIVSQASNVLTVPNSAITHIGTTAYATVLSNNGKTRTRIPIQTGTVGDTSTQVTSGLVQGEKVVLPSLSTSTSSGTTGRGLGGGAVLGGGGGGGGGGGRFGG